jgi:hypothetical protein
VWVAGQWPNRRPFRRAARWDGVFPTHRDVGFNDLIPVDELRAIVAYTQEHRAADAGPLDVIMEGTTPGEADRAGEIVAPYADAGLTWWVERTGWFRGPLEDMRSRIQAGPPRRD